MPKKEGNKRVMVCPRGDYKDGDAAKAEITEHMQRGSTEVDVVEKEEVPYPKVEAECGKCGHKEAYFWMVQTRAGDEPETKFMRCTKCNHTWRDYS